jgi:outer membrane biosynthesis protein TonB
LLACPDQARDIFGDQTLPIWKDLFFSLLLHLLLFAIIITFALWKEQRRDEPLKRIEVTIVSDKELATLRQQANPVTRPKRRDIQTRARAVGPKPISSSQAAPKPALKPAAATRPILKPEYANQPAIKPQTTPELETVLKPKALSEPAVSPEPVVNLEQTSEPVVKLEPAMKPVARFKAAIQPVVRLKTTAKPVLKLKTEPDAVVDMGTMPKPAIDDMEPRPVPVINVGSGSVPISRLKPAALSKPALKAISAPMAKPVLKPELPPIVKPRPETDENYDPFAPLESATTQQHRPPFQSEADRITAKQLSQREIDHYIGRMQTAVEKQWKIPVAVHSIKDPLVEMILQPGGKIQSLIILESSGNDAIDVSLIRAIKAAAPFELPKQQFEYFRTNRIRFHPFK